MGRQMYCALSTAFTVTLDATDLRCYFVLGLVRGLHLLSLIHTEICRVLSLFHRRGSRNSEIMKIFSGPASPKGLEPEYKARSIQPQSPKLLHSAELAMVSRDIQENKTKQEQTKKPKPNQNKTKQKNPPPNARQDSLFLLLVLRDRRRLAGLMAFTSKVFLVLFSPVVDVTGRLTPDFG